jgi:hypothetical protein
LLQDTCIPTLLMLGKELSSHKLATKYDTLIKILQHKRHRVGIETLSAKSEV